ncbi:MAG: hypothetical protein ACM3UU_02385 [Ignavibacteriales bacterium]
MLLKIVEANEKQLAKWDDFIEESVNGTIFHRRDFLSYHGSRFIEKEKWLIIVNGDSPIAQIVLTIDDDGNEIVAKSPYGASYGGITFKTYPTYHHGKEIVHLLLEYLKDNNVNRFIITPPIACCSDKSLDTFYFNLLEAGFKSINRDISSVVIFKENKPIRGEISPNARNMFNKAVKAGVTIVKKGDLNDFWKVMESTFAKHGTSPTHTKKQFEMLTRLLPERIYVDIAYKDNLPIAGIGYFKINKNVNSSYYFCQSTEYQNLQGLSMLVLTALEDSQMDGYKYFDFGTSTVTMIAKENIFNFKENYTKVGFFRETFEWKMSK